MFALAQDWFMVFPALVPLVIFTAEHVYSGNPGDRFSAQGVISHNKRVIYNWYKAVWVYMKHGVYSKQYSLAKRADEISDYLVLLAYVGCFSSKSMVSTWIVSYLLVYTWHTPLHYPHAANAGCVLAGVAPVMVSTGTVGFQTNPPTWGICDKSARILMVCVWASVTSRICRGLIAWFRLFATQCAWRRFGKERCEIHNNKRAVLSVKLTATTSYLRKKCFTYKYVTVSV